MTWVPKPTPEQVAKAKAVGNYATGSIKSDKPVASAHQVRVFTPVTATSQVTSIRRWTVDNDKQVTLWLVGHIAKAAGYEHRPATISLDDLLQACRDGLVVEGPTESTRSRNYYDRD